MAQKKAAEEYGSIVSLVGHDRVYGIRAVLTLPSEYFVFDKAHFAEIRKKDPDADKHNYFDAYFSLCGQASGEDARVEAGMFKYSGETSNQWKSARCGVRAADFHGDLYPEKAFANNTLDIETSFVPGNRKKVALKVNRQTVRGAMVFNIPPSQDTFDAGGLFPKISVGLCNFTGKISFGKTSFSQIEVCHSKDLAPDGWKPFSKFRLVEKFTRGDKIMHSLSPFTAWVPAKPA